MNKVLLIGHIIDRDPASWLDKSGKTVVKFWLSTKEQWIDSDGNKHTRYDKHSIQLREKLATAGVACQLKKGDVCYVEGSIKYDFLGDHCEKAVIVANKFLKMGRLSTVSDIEERSGGELEALPNVGNQVLITE